MTPLELAADVARRLDLLHVPYVIGGSLAAALVGEPRSDAYLDSTAREVGLADLLHRARQDEQLP